MNHVTLINLYEVPAGKEEQFMERWKQAAQYLRQREGFISTRLHQRGNRSLRPVEVPYSARGTERALVSNK